MKDRKGETTDQIVRNQHVTLLELLDRLLDTGVVVKGEILLSVADIDLVYLNLGVLLSSVKTVENVARRGKNKGEKWVAQRTSSAEEFVDKLQTDAERTEVASLPVPEECSQRRDNHEKALPKTLSSAVDNGIDQCLQPK